MARGNGSRVTLTLIAHKIDTLTETVAQHYAVGTKFQDEIRQALDGSDSQPGVRGRVRDLESLATTTRRVFWIVLTALLGGGVAFYFFKV